MKFYDRDKARDKVGMNYDFIPSKKFLWRYCDLFIKIIFVISCILLLHKAIRIASTPAHWHTTAPLFDEEPKIVEQDHIAEYIANQCHLHLVIKQENELALHEVHIKNNGGRWLMGDQQWSICFNHLSELEPFVAADPSESVVSLGHIEGDLYQLTPNQKFQDLPPNGNVIIRFIVRKKAYKYFVMPRWFAMGLDGKAHVIESTDDDWLKFVTIINDDDNLRRERQESRYERTFINDLKRSPLRVLPTPVQSDLNEAETIEVIPSQWTVCGDPKEFKSEIQLVVEKFHFKSANSCPPKNFARVQKIKVDIWDPEGYHLRIDKEKSSIEITAATTTGIFYGIQTLLSLAEAKDGQIQQNLPTGTIVDLPRFRYRGLHLDVARNFVDHEEVIKIIKTMALYKLNKLHLHLTDDEGWRLEIDGLPELTQVGAVRSHRYKSGEGLMPTLGSGPFVNTSGSGYYTKHNYLLILKAASDNHVEVIPEIDTPAHCSAAIRAMEVRYAKYVQLGDVNKAEEFLLNDANDHSNVKSVQRYLDNAINPCIASTYRFMNHVIKEIKELHSFIQPIKTIHIGGDEVPKHTWSKSLKCEQMLNKSKTFPKQNDELQQYFYQRVSEMCKENYSLALALWHDAFFPSNSNRMISFNSDVVIYDYHCNQEQRKSLLEANHKVVVAVAEYLYFDHTQDPDEEELGLRWAAKYIDDKKVFSFSPNTLYGSKISDNVIGMQAHVWSELLRNPEMLEQQIFPRLIAFAERAWHKAAFEKQDNIDIRKGMMDLDWLEFANVVGYKELARLWRRGVAYRLPLPAIRVENHRLYYSSMPGTTLYRKASGQWNRRDNGAPFLQEDRMHEFKFSDHRRSSLAVKLAPQNHPLSWWEYLKVLIYNCPSMFTS